MPENAPPEICSFCRRPRNEVKHLAGGPDGTSICNRCIGQIGQMMSEAKAKDQPEEGKFRLRKPAEILAYLDERVIGQDDAKREMAIAVYEHYRRREVNGKLVLDGEEVEIEKSNILLLGPTGSGKTHISRGMARLLGVPFFVADCSKLTQAGYVGDDVESVLQGLMADAQNNIEEAQWGIVFLDEFDKLARKSGRNASGYRDVTGEGVQQSLLKLLEGTRVSVPRGMGNRVVISGSNNGDLIDTTNILFVASGSFAGIEEIVDQRLNKSSGMGFGKEMAKKRDTTSVYRNVTEEDILEFGLIPEIVGRLPVITSTYELTEEQMVAILTQPKNAICKQFQALYSLDNVKLQFDPEALLCIARQALKKGTGARALRSVLKKVLNPYSFEIPNGSDITAIRITAEAVENPGTGVVSRQTLGTA